MATSHRTKKAKETGPSGNNFQLWRPTSTILFFGTLAVIAIFFGYQEIKDRATHVHETDARIQAKLITVSSRVPGWVTKISAYQGKEIDTGELLLNVDSRDAKLVISELEAKLDAIHPDKQRIIAKSMLVQKKTQSHLISKKTQLNAAKVIVSSLKPQLDLIRNELSRTKTLFLQKVISRRQLDQTDAQLQRVKREHQIAVANLKAARAKIKEAEAEEAQLDVLAAEISVLSKNEAEIKIQIARNSIKVEDHNIKSPVNGVIDKTFVEVGEYVSPGQRLILLHDPKNIWIEANIKETEIRRLKIGQEVKIYVDAYPDEIFSGIIETIGNAATSAFALLPSPNPSGNFTKITQRLPVRIAITQREGRLRPGMMTEIKIVTDQ